MTVTSPMMWRIFLTKIPKCIYIYSTFCYFSSIILLFFVSGFYRGVLKCGGAKACLIFVRSFVSHSAARTTEVTLWQADAVDNSRCFDRELQDEFVYTTYLGSELWKRQKQI